MGFHYTARVYEERSISNLYTLTLPQPLGKLRRSKAVHEYWGEGLPEPTGDPLSFPEGQESRVALRNGAESRCATMQGRTVHNTRVALCDPNIHNKTSINHPDQHHPPAMLKDKSSCIEVVFRFESERKAGEFSRIRNLPALLMSRLQALPSAKF